MSALSNAIIRPVPINPMVLGWIRGGAYSAINGHFPAAPQDIYGGLMGDTDLQKADFESVIAPVSWGYNEAVVKTHTISEITFHAKGTVTTALSDIGGQNGTFAFDFSSVSPISKQPGRESETGWKAAIPARLDGSNYNNPLSATTPYASQTLWTWGDGSSFDVSFYTGLSLGPFNSFDPSKRGNTFHPLAAVGNVVGLYAGNGGLVYFLLFEWNGLGGGYNGAMDFFGVPKQYLISDRSGGSISISVEKWEIKPTANYPHA